jgi:proline iminopeptidase
MTGVTNKGLFAPVAGKVVRLDVGSGHSLHVETCGKDDGVPVVVLHGGPGGGIHPRMRQYFDPEYWRVVLFDQRGAGQSTPLASLDGNHTDALLTDMEKLRESLGIERWWLFGGSWGSTLALLYAERHPDRCLGLILRGIFLGRQRDMEWLYGPQGAARLYPADWQDFVGGLTQVNMQTVLSTYQKKLAGSTDNALLWAKRWARWEARLSTLLPSTEVEASFDERALAIARIENHYFCHNCFIEEGQILRDAGALNDLPGYIVQGQQDMVCPMEQAWLLSQHWHKGQLRVVEGAGHSAMETGIERSLLQAVADAQELSQ